MKQVQQCTECSKFRVLDEHYTWSHWQDVRNMTDQQRYQAQKVKCPFCERQRLVRRCNHVATTSGGR